ncbi:MAG TPA: hypothetical protein VK422_12665 [Pyrinomonadaceae bacterium]|nr:hypothetical protein [Pyrinomonadaceae bacterium]
MSNDQSPPARKVIPYKKGGQRRSPFADMALQFSGTALDVAIQQRAEESEDAAPEVSESPAPALPADGPDSVNASAPERKPTQSLSPEPEPPSPPAEVTPQEPTPPPPAAAAPSGRQRRPAARGVRLVPDKRGGPASLHAADAQLLAFITRWKPFLTETQLGICTYVYNNSEASGEEYCFTSTPKLMAAVAKTERQVKTVLNQLTDWGFLIKGETVMNAPRERRGTYYKLAVTKS